MKQESYIINSEGKFEKKTPENNPNFQKEQYDTEEAFNKKVKEYKGSGWVVVEEREGYVKFENQFSKPVDQTVYMRSGWSPETIEISLSTSPKEKNYSEVLTEELVEEESI